MSISQLPQRASFGASPFESESAPDSLSRRQLCSRSIAAGSLIAGAVLLAKGNLKGALTAAGAGAAVALLEDRERAQAFWRSIPSFLEAGKRLLSQAEGFLGDLEVQREKLRAAIDEAQRS